MSVPVTGQIVRPPQAPLFPQFITTGVQIDSGFGNIGVGAIVAGTATMDLGTNDWYSLTLVNGTSTNVAVTNAMVGQQFTFRLIQDGSANGTVSWFNGIRWASGSPPTLTNTNGAVDTLTFKCVATNSYDGFTTVGGGSGSNGTVTQVNTTNGLTGGPITGTGNAGLAPIATVTLLGNPTNSSAIPSAVTLGPGLAFAGSTLQSFGGSLVGAANVAAGGTGDATLTAHAVLLGEGTSPVAFATVGTAGRVLTASSSV